MDRRRRGARRAARASRSSTSTSPAATARRGAALRRPVRRRAVPALRAPRRLARRGRRLGGDGRLHAAPGRHRCRSRHAGLHVQRGRGAGRGRRAARSVTAAVGPRRRRRACGLDDVFVDDPLRLLRAVRLEDELGFRMDERTEELVRASAALVDRPAGERILGELRRLSPAGYRRLDELGLLEPLGGSLDGPLDAVDDPDFRLVAVFGAADGFRSRTSCAVRATLLRAAGGGPSPRAIHRFRRRRSRGRSMRWRSSGRRSSQRRSRSRGWPIRPSRSCVETSWGFRPGPRSGVSSRHRRGAGSGDDLDARGGARSRALARVWRARRERRAPARAPGGAQRRLADRVRRLLGPFSGNEVALDSGCGRVRSRSRSRRTWARSSAWTRAPTTSRPAPSDAPENVRFVEGDAMALPFEYGEFDIAACIRVLHHVRRPELASRSSRGSRVRAGGSSSSTSSGRSTRCAASSWTASSASATRRTSGSSRMRTSAASSTRTTSCCSLRRSSRERVDLEQRLELAQVSEEERVRIRGSRAGAQYEIEVGWYVSRKPA